MTAMLSNSRTASASICLSRMSEPVSVPHNGVYLGRTSVYRTPFMLDTELMVNPHISVIGTSGSGKTFLLKALITRMALHLGHNVLILDWTGEYSKLVAYLDGREVAVDKDFDLSALGLSRLLDGVASLNMSGLRQQGQRASVTKGIIDAIARQMHRYGVDTRSRHMIVLDEAWRLASDTNELGALFREGRKYGFGVVLATQMAGDIRNEAIANSATMIIFRLQSSDDISLLVSSGVAGQDEADALCNLGQGSCMLHLAFKDSGSLKKNVIIERIAGAEIEFYELRGNKMRISERKFREETEKLHLAEDAKARLFSFVDASDRCMDEVALVSALIKLGLNRPVIVTFLRSLGLDDFSIVAAYEAAITKA
ncbi:MAG: ATP-binding protein [Candidatus Micrarchaeaceae archaeon]